MGDGDDTEILVTEGAIPTENTDDLGIQTSKEAISQLVDQSKTVIPVEDENETTEEPQIIARKMLGTNDLTTTIVISLLFLIVAYNYYYKNGKGLTRKYRDIDIMSHSIVLLVSFSGIRFRDKFTSYVEVRANAPLSSDRWKDGTWMILSCRYKRAKYIDYL